MNFLFDLDDTLYDQSVPFEKAYHDLFSEITDIDLKKLFIDYRIHSDETFAKSEKKEMTMEDMYHYRTAEAFKDNGVLLTRKQALEFQNVYEYYQNHLELDERIRNMLNYLKDNGHFISLITNGPSAHQRDKIRCLQLERWIDINTIIISSETPVRKPDPAIFKIAEKRFSLDLNKTYFVGDSFPSDIEGAAAAGWKTIWFNHRHRNRTSDAKCTYEAFSCEQLFSLICNITENK